MLKYNISSIKKLLYFFFLNVKKYFFNHFQNASAISENGKCSYMKINCLLVLDKEDVSPPIEMYKTSAFEMNIILFCRDI